MEIIIIIVVIYCPNTVSIWNFETYRFRGGSRNYTGGDGFSSDRATQLHFVLWDIIIIIQWSHKIHFPVRQISRNYRVPGYRYMMSSYFQLTSYTNQLTNERKESNEMIIIIIIIIIIIVIISSEMCGGCCSV